MSAILKSMIFRITLGTPTFESFSEFRVGLERCCVRDSVHQHELSKVTRTSTQEIITLRQQLGA